MNDRDGINQPTRLTPDSLRAVIAALHRRLDAYLVLVPDPKPLLPADWREQPQIVETLRLGLSPSAFERLMQAETPPDEEKE